MKSIDVNIPYFDDLLSRLAAKDPAMSVAFSKHVHWGYWERPNDIDGGALDPKEYLEAADALCAKFLDQAAFQPGTAVLDVGCGLGGTITTINERFDGVKMTGLNIDARQIEFARANVNARASNKIEFVVGNANSLPFADQSFDVVLALECIFHFDRERFFKEVKRVLRPGGKLVITDFIPIDINLSLTQFILGLGKRSTIETYGDIDMSYSMRRYENLARSAGMVVASNHDITKNTLPTYAFVRRQMQTVTDKNRARHYDRSTRDLEMLSRYGFMKYRIVSFQSR